MTTATTTDQPATTAPDATTAPTIAAYCAQCGREREHTIQFRPGRRGYNIVATCGTCGRRQRISLTTAHAAWARTTKKGGNNHA